MKPNTPNTFTGSELCKLPAREVVSLLKKREVSPNDLLDAAFERVRSVEPAVNALPTLCEDRARAAVGNLQHDQEVYGKDPGWLAGLPIGIKDLTPVAGVRTTYATLGYKNYVPDESSPLVLRLEKRGGIVVGKTNSPEMGAGGNTFNDVFGYTRNPWDTRKNAGGSSGGAAVSLATGEVWLSHGSDLAGSLRTPAGYCGVVGMRPTPGRAGGGSAEAIFLNEATSGPMARDVADTALFLDAMTGFSPQQPISLARPTVSFQDAVNKADEHVRIAFSEDQNGFAPVEREIREVLRSSMERVSRAGSEVEEACPELPDLYATYVTLRGVFYGTVNDAEPPHIQKHFKRTLRENIEFGRNLTSAQIYEAFRNRSVLYQAMRVFLNNFDALAIPVVGLEPGIVEEEYPQTVDDEPVDDYIDWLRFSFLATTTALPAIAMPVGFTASGMPVGIQLIGPPHGDAKLLQIARAVEEAVGFNSTPIDPFVRHILD
ncbi:MAG: amidase [Rhizobiaceae bacterium]